MKSPDAASFIFNDNVGDMFDEPEETDGENRTNRFNFNISGLD